MENAVLISPADDLETAQGYDRLYFGVEFCEIKIPTADEVKRAVAYAAANDMRFTLVTPYVTDSGLAAVERAIAVLPAAGAIEVVANDFGVLRRMLEFHPNLTPVLGRLLVKQKRGFGISTRRQDAPPALAEQWGFSGADNETVRGYLTDIGVNRVEMDNPAQGIASDFSGSKLAASVYTPYTYVTTTRYCPWAYDGSTWPNMRGRCGRPCLQGIIEETGDLFDRTIFISGNAQFYRHDVLPPENELLDKGIDRLIYEPGLPV
ncbi:MAG: hypothetical protein WC891_04545 [Actinomycetota bacterium]